MDMEASTLDLALAVSSYITQQLETGGGGVVTIPREIAELAVAFTKAAIESLQSKTGASKTILN